MKNLIFIGGIHGSGKGQICKEVIVKTSLIHLTASDILKWNDISEQNSKKVENIKYTQDRLINNLVKIVNPNAKYLLDGHYCLLNSNNIPERIPIQTFIEINPIKIILVIADSKEIKERLEKRDNKIYELSLIEDFQNLEILYAKEISNTLSIPLLIIDSINYNFKDLINFIK
ncbi:ATP-binding protein [uncultured Chryseobacterium sp.]|uniref:ATP-binding protein n=1 Tax=uncultured Chryseobacterium sp. TaxID=259322 RepID=UPI002584621D|nr:ATP-binding protein [uncultured Chryseobacterium sp.]